MEDYYESIEDYIKGSRKKLDDLGAEGIPSVAIVSGTYLPDFHKTKEDDVDYLVTRKVSGFNVSYEGITVDRRHAGIVRSSTGREKDIYNPGTKIRQNRHVLAISQKDCDILSDRLGVQITPELLGANLLITGLKNIRFSLSMLPENTHLLFYEPGMLFTRGAQVATMKHEALQRGCKYTAKAIADHYDDKSLVKKFIQESKDHRGVLLSVQHPADNLGFIREFQRVKILFSKGETR